MKITQIYSNGDLWPGTVGARQGQMQQYRDARRGGKQVYWNYRKLAGSYPSPHHPRGRTIAIANTSTTNSDRDFQQHQPATQESRVQPPPTASPQERRSVAARTSATRRSAGRTATSAHRGLQTRYGKACVTKVKYWAYLHKCYIKIVFV